MPLPPLLTAAEFAAATPSVHVDDPRLMHLLNGATAAVRRYCGWHIAPVVAETVTVDGPGGANLQLPTLRLVAVNSITVGGEVLASNRFDWSALGDVRLRSGWWPTRYRSIVADIEHGFEAAPDVGQVIRQVVANGLSSPMGATREQAGAMSVSWATTAPGVSGGLSLLQRDLAVLDRYRIGWGR